MSTPLLQNIIEAFDNKLDRYEVSKATITLEFINELTKASGWAYYGHSYEDKSFIFQADDDRIFQIIAI